MTLKRFDAMGGGHLATERDYCDDGEFVDADVAQELYDALVAAVDCGMVPISSAKDGGAARHSRQVHVADQIRAAIAKATGEQR